MWFHIAKDSGRTVREAQEVITDSEFNDYLLFYKDYPPINHHMTTLMSQLTYITWYAQPGNGARKRFKIKDFIPSHKEALPSRDIVASKIRAIFGGSAKKGE